MQSKNDMQSPATPTPANASGQAAARGEGEGGSFGEGLWQPIATAPRDGTRIVLCSPRVYLALVGRWSVAEGFWLATLEQRFYTEIHFTHWAPLP